MDSISAVINNEGFNTPSRCFLTRARAIDPSQRPPFRAADRSRLCGCVGEPAAAAWPRLRTNAKFLISFPFGATGFPPQTCRICRIQSIEHGAQKSGRILQHMPRCPARPAGASLCRLQPDWKWECNVELRGARYDHPDTRHIFLLLSQRGILHIMVWVDMFHTHSLLYRLQPRVGGRVICPKWSFPSPRPVCAGSAVSDPISVPQLFQRTSKCPC